MRYYDISITDTSGKVISIDGFDMLFTSFKNGRTIPSALNIEMDIPIVTEDVPAGNAYIKIWGVDLSLINKASNLNFQSITIRGGMQKGLPLATQQANYSPIRNGIILQGTILQALGNWQGNEQTLDLIIMTRLVKDPAITKPTPIVIECKTGASLQDAISTALNNAGINSVVKCDPRLVPSAPGLYSIYPDINLFAQDMLTHSKRILNDQNYLGLKFAKIDDGYYGTDNTQPADTPIKIEFNDLIGQPTWLNYNEVQLKCVMRSDIKVANIVTMPKSNIIQGKFFAPKNEIFYTGDAFVSSVRHIGNFRQPDANSWVSVINVIPNRK